MAEQKGAPAETGAPHAHEYVAFRLLTIELADSNALAVLVNVTEVADATDSATLAPVAIASFMASSTLSRSLYHLCRNAARVQSPAQTEETSLMLNSRLAYQMSSPLEK